jgi:hypothetical protein
MDDICEQLHHLDPDDPEHQRAILRRDKHTRVEGICVEHLFKEKFITPNFTDHSSGFWFTRKHGAFRVVKLLIDPGHFNQTDEKVLSHLQSHGVMAWVVYHDAAAREFKVLRYHEGCMAAYKTIARDYPRTYDRISMAAERDRNASRHEKAFAYLEEHGGLKDAAIERLFANCWIGNTWFWDIDQFVIHDGSLIAFEVKQKYPTAAGTFGLNVGLVRLFAMLSATKIRVVHVVLTKPDSNISTPALDLLTHPLHRKNAGWLACEFKPAILSTRTGEAPSYTSIHGTSAIKYHHIARSAFTDLGGVDGDPDRMMRFLEGSDRK